MINYYKQAMEHATEETGVTELTTLADEVPAPNTTTEEMVIINSQLNKIISVNDALHVEHSTTSSSGSQTEFDPGNPTSEMLFIQSSLNQTLATQIEPLKDQLRQVLEVVTPLSVIIQDLVEFKNKTLNQLAEHSSRVLILAESNTKIKTSIKTLNTQLANHKLNSNAIPQLKEKLAAQASALKNLTSQVELEKQLNISKFKNLNTEFIKVTSEKEFEILGATKDDVNFLQASQ